MTKHIARIVILALALGPWSTPAWAQQSPAIPISATSLPLPSGASTSANQSSIITELQAVNTALGGTVTVDNAGTFAVQAAQSGTWTVQPGNTANTTAWLVTGTGGTFPATQSGTWNVNNVSGTVSLPTGASTAANQSTAITALQLIDNPVGSGPGAGTAATASYLVGGVYNTTLPTLTNGQQAGAQFSSRGALISTLVAADGTAWTPSTDFAHSGALTIGTSAGPVVMGRASAAAPSTTGVVDDDAVHAWMLPTGASVVQPSYAGTLASTGNGTAGAGTPRVTIASDNTAFTVNVGTFPDNEPINIAQMNGVTVTMGNGVSGTGVQRVTLASDSTGTLAGVTTVTTLTGGGVAHDAADSGNPLKVGGRVDTSLSDNTIMTTNDRSDLFMDGDGAVISRAWAPLADMAQDRATNTDGASTAFAGGLAAPGASVRLYLTSCTIANSSATAVTVDLRDGAAGSVLWTFPVPENTSGVTHSWASPLKFTANTAVAYDGSAAASTITISCSGFKSRAG